MPETADKPYIEPPITDETALMTMRIPIDLIYTTSANPRALFDDADMAELIESVRQRGILQAITVRQVGDRYEIVIGERRFRAATAVGLEFVPCRVVEISDEDALIDALAENMVRANLKPLEVAAGWSKLQTEYGWTQGRIAEKFGKTQPVVSQTIALLKLPQGIQEYLRHGDLSASHGTELVAMQEFAEYHKVIDYAEQAVRDGWSVKTLRARANELFEYQQPKLDVDADEPPGVDADTTGSAADADVDDAETAPDTIYHSMIGDEVEVPRGCALHGRPAHVESWKDGKYAVAGHMDDGSPCTAYLDAEDLRKSAQTTLADYGAPVGAGVTSPTTDEEDGETGAQTAAQDAPEGDSAAVADPSAGGVAADPALDEEPDDTAAEPAPLAAAAPVQAEPAPVAKPAAASPAPPIDRATNVTPPPAPSAPPQALPGWTYAMVKTDDYDVLRSRGLWPLSAIIADVERLNACALDEAGAEVGADIMALQDAGRTLLTGVETARHDALYPNAPVTLASMVTVLLAGKIASLRAEADGFVETVSEFKSADETQEADLVSTTA